MSGLPASKGNQTPSGSPERAAFKDSALQLHICGPASMATSMWFRGMNVQSQTPTSSGMLHPRRPLPLCQLPFAPMAAEHEGFRLSRKYASPSLLWWRGEVYPKSSPPQGSANSCKYVRFPHPRSLHSEDAICCTTCFQRL